MSVNGGQVMSASTATSSGYVVTYDPEKKFDSQLSDNKNKAPLADYKLAKESKCSERSYDWFTVPNYHIGNKYEHVEKNANKTCYSPCKDDKFVPSYGIDPVDGTFVSFYNNSDKLDKCVSIDTYFAGKYSNGFNTGNSAYCPLAMIHQIDAYINADKLNYSKYVHTSNTSRPQFVLQTSSSSQSEKNGDVKTLQSGGGDAGDVVSGVSKQLASCSEVDVEKIDRVREGFAVEDKTYSDTTKDQYDASVARYKDTVKSDLSARAPPANVSYPSSREMIDACNSLNDETSRVEEAYEICSKLKDDDANRTSDHDKSLKQACNLVFCDPSNTALKKLSGKDQVCFDTNQPEPVLETPIPVPENNRFMDTLKGSPTGLVSFIVVLGVALGLLWLNRTVLRYLWERYMSSTWLGGYGTVWGDIYGKRDAFVKELEGITSLYAFNSAIKRFQLK